MLGAHDSGLLIELRALRVEVAELREDLDALLRRQLGRDDRRLALALLPLAHDLAENCAFTAPGLYSVALDDRSEAGQAMRELIAEASGDDQSQRAFGQFLARIAGAPLAGLRLVADGETRDGRRWRIVRVAAGM